MLKPNSVPSLGVPRIHFRHSKIPLPIDIDVDYNHTIYERRLRQMVKIPLMGWLAFLLGLVKLITDIIQEWDPPSPPKPAQ
jgi:hypothetical protein